MPSLDRPTVVLGLVGVSLDAGKGPDRWERWRPSVSIAQQPDLLVHRFELLHSRKAQRLAEQVAEDVALVSPETRVRRHVVEMDDPWDFEEVFGALHDFARAYPFDPENENYLVHITTGTHVAQICLFLLTESRHLPAKLLQTAPPTRGDRTGQGAWRTIDLDLSKYDRLATRFTAETAESLSFLKSGIETRNAAFNRLIERIEQVAIASKAPILLSGPTGAGKSQLARRIHELRRARRLLDGPFVAVNCATIRGDGAGAALFGHTRGAFTGAVAARAGLLRAADGGQLFLDEIGELGLEEQAMLLRAVEEKTFTPVGSDREVKSDFLLVAGTNRDLRESVRHGTFREDLLARIDLWTFRLPGLRERPEDLEPNLRYELDRFAGSTGRRVSMNREAQDRFLDFARSREALWTANFRDFGSAVTRMATLATSGRIGVDLVDEEIARLRQAWAVPGAADRDSEVLGRHLPADAVAELDRFDRVQLAEVLRVAEASRTLSEAGRELFSASRARRSSTNDADRLRKYLTRYRLDFAAIAGTSRPGIRGE